MAYARRLKRRGRKAVWVRPPPWARIIMSNVKIGFIGQGYVGKNYADDFESRGHSIIRYAKEEPYCANKDKIKDCEVVFVAVPTPTTEGGYDASIIRSVLSLTNAGAIIVLKSTIFPGLTKVIQKEFPDRIVMHSPEFLSEATAAYDAAHPFLNVIGVSNNSAEHRRAAELVLAILPEAPLKSIVTSEEAELIKYAHNCSAYTQIIFFNLMYDLAQKFGADWKAIEEVLKADPHIPNRYASPVHKSGRGAGGHCFIKDFAALREVYKKTAGDLDGTKVLESMEQKNIQLLKQTSKDLDLLRGVYGESI